ncbi:hypothetical protein [Nocardioides sp. MH1]|uniref:hypothetical protein n=1 Tax=Nocardioides sp. MH1 TaxID=3242490 RepID=UPI0035215FFD
MATMTRSGALRPAALLCLGACLVLALYGLVYLGFAIEPTSSADASAQHGQEVAFPAVVGAIAAAVALAAGDRPWARLGVGVSAVAIAASVALALLG